MREEIRWCLPIMVRLTGKRFPELEKEMEKMSAGALRDLHLLLREAEDAVARERRTFRMWPGGPRMRL